MDWGGIPPCLPYPAVMNKKEYAYVTRQLANSMINYNVVKNRNHTIQEEYYLKSIVNVYIDMLERFSNGKDYWNDIRRYQENRSRQ